MKEKKYEKWVEKRNCFIKETKAEAESILAELENGKNVELRLKELFEKNREFSCEIHSEGL